MDNTFKKLRVLVVDGQQESAKLLRGALATLRVTDVAVAENSIAALKALSVDIYDVVFCDVGIGPIDLWEFAGRLRLDEKARNRRVPIIVMTQNPQLKLVELARDTGINDIIVRPLSVSAVKRRLQSAVLAPKPFIAADCFAGPDRRHKDRRELPVEPETRKDRRYHRRRTDAETGA